MTTLIFGWSDHSFVRRMRKVFVALAPRLSTPECWRLFRVGDDGVEYFRLVYIERAHFEIGGSERRYRAAFHFFERPAAQVTLHNHRFAAAILPFAESVLPETPLYEMPYQAGEESGLFCEGTYTARAWEPYTMLDALRVRHAVRSFMPHMSFTLADVTDGPARENRLTSIECSPDETIRFCRRFANTVQSAPVLVN